MHAAAGRRRRSGTPRRSPCRGDRGRSGSTCRGWHRRSPASPHRAATGRSRSARAGCVLHRDVDRSDRPSPWSRIGSRSASVMHRRSGPGRRDRCPAMPERAASSRLPMTRAVAPACGGVPGLHHEGAPAAVDQRDLARHGRGVRVRRAAVGRRTGRTGGVGGLGHIDRERDLAAESRGRGQLADRTTAPPVEADLRDARRAC